MVDTEKQANAQTGRIARILSIAGKLWRALPASGSRDTQYHYFSAVELAQASYQPERKGRLATPTENDHMGPSENPTRPFNRDP